MRGLPVFSYEGHLYDSHHREPSLKSNAVFPIKKPTYTQDQAKSFMNDVRPMFEIYRLLGQFPHKTEDSGQTMTQKVFRIWTLYAILIQGGMVIGGALVWKQRIEYINKEKPLFGQAMVEATFLGALVTLFTRPFTNLLETNKNAEYMSSWADYQRYYEAVVGRPLHLNLRRKAEIYAVLTLLICSAITSFPFLTLNDFRSWFVIPFSYVTLCCVMSILTWHFCGQALVTAAKALIEQVEHVLVTSEFGCAEKIAEYRLLWLKLSKMTQDKGNSMGYTYGTQVIACFVEQVLAVYGLLANLREGFAVNNVVFVSSAVIFSSFIMVICNTAQCATEEVGINTQRKLQQLFHKIPSRFFESRREVRLFIKTIVENPPTVSFSGFVIVNRGLQTSLMSAMVTYLVVLIQFQMSTQPNPTNATSNKSAT